MLCKTILLYHTIAYHAISYHIMPYHIISNHILSYHIILFYAKLFLMYVCCTVLYCALLYYTRLDNTIPHYILYIMSIMSLIEGRMLTDQTRTTDSLQRRNSSSLDAESWGFESSGFQGLGLRVPAICVRAAGF